jgi:hypothetical protein
LVVKGKHDAKHDKAKIPKHLKKYQGAGMPSILQYARILKTLKDTRAAVVEEQKAFQSKYSLVDVKGGTLDSFADKLKLLDMEITQNLQSVKNALGSQNNYVVDLSVTQLFASTVTTGVVAGVQPINASSIADFTALAGLFEEYKISEVDYKFICGIVGASASTTPANTGNLMMVMGYSLNNTAYTSVGAAADDHFVKLYSMPTIDSAGRFFSTGIISPHHYSYKAKMQPGVLSAGATVATGEWLVTTDSTTPFGYLKVYWVAGSATATANALNGVSHLKFHFRNRV